jgi:hypothetical protein
MRCEWLCLISVAVLVASSPAFSAEAPQPLADEQVAQIAKQAPQVPVDLRLDLKLRLLDFVDCANPADPHGFMDQGTSSVVTGPAGKYRITAAHRHAFFSYRMRSAGRDKPVLIVWEYPDDAERTIDFCTHESALTGRANNDWSLETGVYTGDPLPLTNKMQYHTFIMWPSDQWPCVIVANFHRYGHPAAASRIWVYAIEEPLPKLQVAAPEPDNQRRLGHYNSLYFLPTDLHFGLRSPNAIQHMLDYCQYVGVNELSWGVVTNNSWGFSCQIPAWDGGDKSTHLDDVLKAMDARGGMSLVAGFDLDGGFLAGGKRLGDMTPDERKAVLIKGFDQFVDRYGKSKSLKGIAMGGQYGIAWLRDLNKEGLAQDIVTAIKSKKPDLDVITYVGGRTLHAEYFDGENVPNAGDVVAAWEAGGRSWPEVLGDAALGAWKTWGQDPAELKKIKGLTVYEQLQPDDHRIFGLYAQQPRAMIYYDLDNSQRRSDAIDSHYANLWNTHYEGWLGLWPDYNYWYRKLWVAPDFSAPPPRSLASLARALGLRDRLVICAGSWNNKFFGHETDVRRFARAFRALPPVPMNDVQGLPVDTVRVRWVTYKGKRFVAVQSLIPFESRLSVDGKAVALPPYELVSWSDEKTTAPAVSAEPCGEYKAWLEQRLARFAALCGEVKALSAEAVPDAYARLLEQARGLVGQGQLYTADMMLGAGLTNELQLRKDILMREPLRAPKVASAPPMDGNLDAWPTGASDIRVEGGEYLAGHIYFPNSWTGPQDLSARLRLAHDGQKLYVGAEVRDNVLEEKDSCGFRLSKDGYLDWRKPSVPYEVSWSIPAPLDQAKTAGDGARGFSYVCHKTPTGYVVEGSAPLSELGVKPGGAIGFLLFVSDGDKTPNLKEAAWACKQALLYPHKPNFEYWSDARTCGKLVLE